MQRNHIKCGKLWMSNGMGNAIFTSKYPYLLEIVMNTHTHFFLFFNSSLMLRLLFWLVVELLISDFCIFHEFFFSFISAIGFCYFIKLFFLHSQVLCCLFFLTLWLDRKHRLIILWQIKEAHIYMKSNPKVNTTTKKIYIPSRSKSFMLNILMIQWNGYSIQKELWTTKKKK